MENSFSILGCDEKVNLDLLEALGNFDDFHCVSVCKDESEALESILKNSPAIVFIDIDPKGKVGNPFHFAHQLHLYTEVLPSFVAISSSKRMAYEVIKNNFLDYLLKPFSEFELRKCLMKFQKNNKQLESAKICLRSYSDYQFLNLNEVLYLKADNNTSDFFLQDDKKVSAFKSLKYFDQNLPGNFLRVHHSYMVNTHRITRINFGKSLISLEGISSKVPFSKSYKVQVENLKENFYSSLSVVI